MIQTYSCVWVLNYYQHERKVMCFLFAHPYRCWVPVFPLELRLQIMYFCFVNWQLDAVTGISYAFLMYGPPLNYSHTILSLFHDCLAAFASSVTGFISLQGENAAWITVSANINVEIVPCHKGPALLFIWKICIYSRLPIYLSNRMFHLFKTPKVHRSTGGPKHHRWNLFYRSYGDPRQITQPTDIDISTGKVWISW